MIRKFARLNLPTLLILLLIPVLVSTGHAGGTTQTEPLFGEERVATNYFVLRRDRGFVHAEQLDEVVICGRPDGGLVDNQAIKSHFSRLGTRYQVLMFNLPKDQLAAFVAGRCDVLAIYDYYDMARAERDFGRETHIALPLDP